MAFPTQSVHVIYFRFHAGNYYWLKIVSYTYSNNTHIYFNACITP